MSTFIGAIGKGIGLSMIFATGFVAGIIAGIAIERCEAEETKHD